MGLYPAPYQIRMDIPIFQIYLNTSLFMPAQKIQMQIYAARAGSYYGVGKILCIFCNKTRPAREAVYTLNSAKEIIYIIKLMRQIQDNPSALSS